MALLAANVLVGAAAVGAFPLSGGAQPARFWEVQAVDTMKYSRDLAREKLGDPTFDVVIDRQVAAIAASGATHVAVGTPYDDEFVPVLKRWVEAARRHGLNVWFRGNWSGWEGWFGYASLDRDEHIRRTEAFIHSHPDLFADGDVFTPCPECENGGPGDPRVTHDVAGFRQFLITEYRGTSRAFVDIGKDVRSNFASMNGDVARLVMDPETTAALDGVVTVDHYVATPQQLRDDLVALQRSSGGQVVLGEFGAPIPDIHGQLSAEQQARWIESALHELSRTPGVLGVNYWLAVGGSTQLWDDGGVARPAAAVVAGYFRPQLLHGVVHDELGQPVHSVAVSDGLRSSVADTRGYWQLPVVPGGAVSITATAEGYYDRTLTVPLSDDGAVLTLVKQDRSVAYDVFAYLVRLVCAACRV